MFDLIPAPVSIQEEAGAAFSCNSLCYSCAPVSAVAMEEFCSFCAAIPVTVTQGDTPNLVFHPAELPAESYRLVVRDRIEIIYGDTAGALYALQTLKQLLLQRQGGALPLLTIVDAPHYQYRGFMLDVGRYFYPVEDVKRFLRQMALHKLNRFHLHLTEDQGWRIEIKQYPLLTQKGARRSHTNFGWRPHGGFYTQEQIRDIVAYAHAFCIQVIPEFDIPGHTMAAIACYPELGCFDRKLKVKTHWGVKHDILCAGKESTYRFVYNVLDELMALFPDGVIHLGGDEAVKMRWNICPHCQQKIKALHLKDSEELQQYFMTEIHRYLQQHGYTSMMWNWDAIQVSEQLTPEIAWNLCGVDAKTAGSVLAELEKGRQMVNTTPFAYYLDFPYGWVSLRKIADFDPDQYVEHPNMIGVEAPLWTEYVPSLKKADYMMFPRLGAFATTAWSPKIQRGFAAFRRRLPAYQKLLEHYGIRYASAAQAEPNPMRAFFSGLWFQRRQLHWEGLHNLIEDLIVKQKYGRR